MRCALADVAVALAIIMSAGAIVAPQERAALLDLYETCTGHLWVHQHNWLNGDPCEQAWYGVFCDPANSTVLVLDTSPRFAFNLLDCVLPPSLGNLTNLTQLYLSNDLFHSRLHGELPDTLQQLKALRCFYVSHGELSGPIPSWIATLPVLQGLFMRHNSFSGELPDLSAAQYLEDVWFDTQSGDGLTGSIDWLGNMTYLTHVRISFPLHCAGLPVCALARYYSCH